MKDIIDMSRHRGYFIDQSQSLNLFMEGANFAKLTSMHFYAWQSGLKTGMYYLRTKSAVDAKKFTLSAEKKEAPKPSQQQVAARAAQMLTTQQTAPVAPQAETEKVSDSIVQHAQAAANMQVQMTLDEPAAPYEAQQADMQSQTASSGQTLNTEPMTADEMKAIIAQAKSGQADDDCVMCGS